MTLIVTGEAQEWPREKLREINWEQPQAFVKLDCEADRLIKCLRANHVHMVYGDFSRHLKELCSVLQRFLIALSEEAGGQGRPPLRTTT